MTILIIEDEPLAARKLQKLVLEIDPSVKIVGMTDSIESSVEWLESNPHPDVLLMDIELADGQSFEIFHAYEDEIERLRGRMGSEAGKALYRRRKEQIERRIGDSKEHRKLRKFTGRGRDRARVQVGLTVMVHNIVEIGKGECHGETREAKGTQETLCLFEMSIEILKQFVFY